MKNQTLRNIEQLQMASPAIDENVDLTNRPIKYLTWRLKALHFQEIESLKTLASKGALKSSQIATFDRNLDIPLGAIKDETTFS